ncbi:MAG: FAD-dependent oxidoreductase, partial [bacterium]
MEADTVIVAIGQASDFSFLQDGIKITEKGTISVDPLTLATDIEGVFAGGDVVSGPASAIEAIAHGKRAATSIDRYIRGEDLVVGRGIEEQKTAEIPEVKIEPKRRQAMPMLPLEKRMDNFTEVELGFSEAAAVEEANRCLNCGICSECIECVKVCEAEAIDHEMHERRTQIAVGAVILSPGFELFDARLRGEYGFGIYDNVITNIQFERMLSASGPSQGRLARPSDGEGPRKIAFILCVGSRDTARGNEYCCSMGCMSSTKEAIIAKEHEPDIGITIFFTDIRAFGKGFERYYQSAQNQYGIRYQRCMISKVVELQQTKNLKITYVTDEGTLQEEEFDLVVLACGLIPTEEVKGLAETLGLSLNGYGFCRREEFSPSETSRPGILVAGVFGEPKDIPETVVEASSAAAEASRLLAPARGSLTIKKEYPPERAVQDELPRIGVFICRCGRNIGAVVDVPEVVEYARMLPEVVCAEEFLYTCSQDALEKIKEKIAENKLNRVVVASCTPLTHAPIFRDTIREAGLNPYLFEMASIREHCSWVHMEEPEKATAKAKELVAMAVAKASLLKPIKRALFELSHKGLVIGGGLSGLTAALSLAEQGFEVCLVEKKGELGGHLSKIYFTLNGEDSQELLKKTIEQVRNHHLIEVYTNAEVKEI